MAHLIIGSQRISSPVVDQITEVNGAFYVSGSTVLKQQIDQVQEAVGGLEKDQIVNVIMVDSLSRSFSGPMKVMALNLKMPKGGKQLTFDIALTPQPEFFQN